MKLDRHINKNRKGKYALVKLREIPGRPKSRPALARAIMKNPKVLDWGFNDTAAEFFLIRLRDKYAHVALLAYAAAAEKDDPQYAEAIRKLAQKSGPMSKFCKKPD